MESQSESGTEQTIATTYLSEYLCQFARLDVLVVAVMVDAGALNGPTDGSLVQTRASASSLVPPMLLTMIVLYFALLSPRPMADCSRKPPGLDRSPDGGGIDA